MVISSRKSASRKSRAPRKSTTRNTRAPRKSSSRKSRVVRKSVSRKSRVRKSTSRKSTSSKSRVRKSTSRKSTSSKNRVRKSTSRKSTSSKSRVRKSTSMKSRVVRKSTSRKSRVVRKSTSKKSRVRKSTSRKSRSLTKIEKIKEVIEREILKSGIDIKLGNFIGAGVYSIVFEGFDSNGTKLAVKYTKERMFVNEVNILSKLNELVFKINGEGYTISALKYCGLSLEKSLNCDKKVKDIFNDPKKALILGLEVINESHNKGILHNDIKFDNICVIYEKSRIKLKLMDYSESVDIKLEPYLRRQIVEIKNNFKKELLEPKVIDLYNGNNYYDLFLEGLKPLEINSTKRNHLCNVYTSLHKRLFTYKGGDYVYGNDIESYIWSLLSYYYDPAKDGDFSKYMSFSKNFKEWTSLRLDPNNIKIPILRDAMIEIRKDFDITVPELCKRLKLNCEFL